MYPDNHVPIRDISQSITGCCPPFDPADWDEQTFVFKDKLFVKFKTRSFLHVPLNMNDTMKNVMNKIEKVGADNHEYLMLSDEVSPWVAEQYLAVSKPVPGTHMVTMSGTFIAKVFEGPFKNMKQWQKQLVSYVKSQDKKPIKTYFSYVMCPRCVKAYGKNYVIGFEQVEEGATS